MSSDNTLYGQSNRKQMSPEHAAAAREGLEDYPNVVGVGIGVNRVDGVPTGEKALVILVTEKETEDNLEMVLPKTIEVNGETIPTDVQVVGELETAILDPSQPSREPAGDSNPRTEMHRPVVGGISGGHQEITAGTVGSPLLRLEDGTLAIVTNAHVGAPIGEAEEGDLFTQPGPYDAGNFNRDGDNEEPTDEQVIGRLHDFYEIQPDEPNKSDSSIIAVDAEKVASEKMFRDFPDLAGFEPNPPADATFKKVGRTSGVSEARLRTRNTRATVRGYYPDSPGPTVFEGVDVLGGMSEGGDSGSLIGIEREDGFYATHLLFGGSPTSTIAVPIGTVMDIHGIEEVVSPDDL